MQARHPTPSVVALDDETLIARVQDGDEAAFTALYRRHARFVAGIAYRLLGNDAEVDDVVQDSFQDVLAGIRGLREAKEFRAWVKIITVRRVYKRFVHRRRWAWLSGAVERVAATCSNPHDRQLVDALYDELEKLPAKVRIPWTLHMIEGETLPEVARLCDASLATVKRRIAEASATMERSRDES